MSVDRVATNNQSSYLLQQIMRNESALNKTQAQISSGKIATDYAGMGGKAAVLEAARSAATRADATQSNTQFALIQADLQNTQLTSFSGLADQLRQAVTKAVGNNDASTLMADAQGVFERAAQILNAKDANGNYIYGGDKDSTPPFTAASLSDLASMTSVSDAFANGTIAKSVNLGDGQTVKVGVLASDIGTQLMQALKDIATFDAGPNGNFGSGLTDAQSTFLSGEIQSTQAAGQSLNTVLATNGNLYNQLNEAISQQQSLSTLYKGFVSSLEDTDMASAATQLSQNQTALQAAVAVTAQLNQVSLLNYLTPASTG